MTDPAVKLFILRIVDVLEVIPPKTALPETWEEHVAALTALKREGEILGALCQLSPAIRAQFTDVLEKGEGMARMSRNLWDALRSQAEAHTGMTVCLQEPPPGHEGLLRGYIDTMYVAVTGGN